MDLVKFVWIAMDIIPGRILYEVISEGNLEATRVLLRSGVQPRCPSTIHTTILHQVVHHCLDDCMEIAHLLVCHGADVNALDTDYNTPLHYAAVIGHLGMVQLLVAMGADLRMRNCHNMTPLHYAMYYEHEDVVEFLLEICDKTSKLI